MNRFEFALHVCLATRLWSSLANSLRLRANGVSGWASHDDDNNYGRPTVNNSDVLSGLGVVLSNCVERHF